MLFMSHIDTLKTYEDLIATGIPENQAKAQVKALDEAFDGIDAVRKAELELAIFGVTHAVDLLRKDFSGLQKITIGFGTFIVIPVLIQLAIAFLSK